MSIDGLEIRDHGEANSHYGEPAKQIWQIKIDENNMIILDERRWRAALMVGLSKRAREYIEFVLTEFLREGEPEPAYTPEEEEAIKERLRRPGIHPIKISTEHSNSHKQSPSRALLTLIYGLYSHRYAAFLRFTL